MALSSEKDRVRFLGGLGDVIRAEEHDRVRDKDLLLFGGRERSSSGEDSTIGLARLGSHAHKFRIGLDELLSSMVV